MTEMYTEIEDGKILITIDKSIYEKEAVMATAYKMTESCVFLVKPLGEKCLGVYMEPKNNQDKDELKAIAKKFCNQMLDQQLRLDTEKQFGNIRDLLIKQAFSPIENIQDKIKI